MARKLDRFKWKTVLSITKNSTSMYKRYKYSQLNVGQHMYLISNEVKQNLKTRNWRSTKQEHTSETNSPSDSTIHWESYAANPRLSL